jgi:hypothetical protein
MAKKFSETVSGTAQRCRSLMALALLGCLLIAGCAQRDGASEEDRSGGFYGGVSGGLSR